ncbi:MAG: adventurous gliding motility lipoprotein CglB [Myxococcaceae bacterium]|nr:adventurous gliding motility lipoprotein CglB [Myxococcaceae bacterium]
MQRLSFLAGAAACAAAVCSCQTYDFEPVTPFTIAQKTQITKVQAHQLKPDLMLLIDKSGSMVEPTDCGKASCPRKIDDLVATMNILLTDYATVARTGMAKFPANDFCAATSGVDVPLSQSNDVDQELIDSANAIKKAIGNLTPKGGTPTGNSLRFLNTYEPLVKGDVNRSKYVLLLTDGQPNCNDALAPQAKTCTCTAAPNASGCQSTDPMGNVLNQCLDHDGAVAAVAALKKNNVKTAVVGFGKDTSTPTSRAVLNDMAIAGDFPRSCKTDADCFGSAGGCDTAAGQCVTRFFQASDAVELAKALKKIFADIDPNTICTYRLDEKPTDPAYLSVIFDGQPLQPGPSTWTYDPAGKIVFTGDPCAKLTASTVQNPVHLEFRIVSIP